MVECNNISIDKSSSVKNQGKPVDVYFGIDGGGTKTEYLMFSNDGGIKKRLITEGCSPSVYGVSGASETLQKGISSMLEENLKVKGIFVGAAGFGSGDFEQKMTDNLKASFPNVMVQCKPDIYNVIASGTNANRCIAAICGTGSIVYAYDGLKLRRFGGWGYLFDKKGSGYDIGREALCTALADREGSGRHSLISDLVEEKLQNTIWEGIYQFYEKDQSHVAAYAPLVFQAYEMGDEVAAEILQNNAERLAYLINCAYEKCDCGNQVILSGGVIKNSKIYRDMVRQKVNPDVEMIIPVYPQVYGSCVMCCRMCGEDSSLLAEHFMEQYHSICNK